MIPAAGAARGKKAATSKETRRCRPSWLPAAPVASKKSLAHFCRAWARSSSPCRRSSSSRRILLRPVHRRALRITARSWISWCSHHQPVCNSGSSSSSSRESDILQRKQQVRRARPIQSLLRSPRCRRRMRADPSRLHSSPQAVRRRLATGRCRAQAAHRRARRRWTRC